MHMEPAGRYDLTVIGGSFGGLVSAAVEVGIGAEAGPATGELE